MIRAFRELKRERTTILLVEQNFRFAEALGDLARSSWTTAASCIAPAWPIWPATGPPSVACWGCSLEAQA
jgi:hypothetical protein